MTENPTGPTLEELRKRASDLNVKGRSKMGPEELAEAIASAELAGDLQPGTADEVGRPPLAEVAAERAENRKRRRRVIGDAGEEG